MTDPDELDLVVAARKGDQRAFATLIERHASRLTRLATGVVGPVAAEDVVQETVLEAWRAMPSFRGDARIGTWLHTICHRQALRVAHSARRPIGMDDPVRLAELEWADPDWTVDPSAVAVHASDRADLLAAIERLAPVYRTALVLHDVDGLPSSEIADITDVPLGTAKARIRRARMAIVSELARRDSISDAQEALR